MESAVVELYELGEPMLAEVGAEILDYTGDVANATWDLAFGDPMRTLEFMAFGLELAASTAIISTCFAMATGATVATAGLAAPTFGACAAGVAPVVIGGAMLYLDNKDEFHEFGNAVAD